MYRTTLIAAALATTGLLAACSTPETATAPSTQPSVQAASPTPSAPTADTAAEAGAWITLAQYEKQPADYHDAGEVVLFFNASWCPTCQEAVKNLDSDGVPSGLTVVSVDYDSNQDLRQQYGVTVQHTFVVVSEDGQKQKAFTGSLTGQKIAEQAA